MKLKTLLMTGLLASAAATTFAAEAPEALTDENSQVVVSTQEAPVSGDATAADAPAASETQAAQ